MIEKNDAEGAWDKFLKAQKIKLREISDVF